MAFEKPPFKTAEAAWESLSSSADGMADDEAMRGAFMAGVCVALSIAFHYGFADVAAEANKEFWRVN